MNVKTGTETCATTAANIYVTTGFIPSYVMVVNVSSGGKCKVEWYKGMADAAAIKTATAGDITILTTLGITPSTVGGTWQGFMIGLDTDVNVASEVLYWFALGD